MVFYEITKNAIRAAVGAAARPVAGTGQRAAGAPRARLPGRLQSLAAAVEEGAARTLGRARAEPGAAHDLRARGRDRRLQGAGVLDARGRGRAHGQAFPLKLLEYPRPEGRAVQLHQRDRGARSRAHRAGSGRRGAPGRSCEVLAIDRKQRRRNPAPPFTTSTLQQEAARKLGFNARRTMRLAQQLYEGLDIGEGSVGLITYMRTDSVSLAAEAVQRDPRGRRAALRQGRRSPKSRASTRPSRRTPRRRTRRSARPRRRSRPPTSRARSRTTSTGCTRSSGSARSPRR